MKYFIDRHKRTIVAVMENCEDDFFNQKIFRRNSGPSVVGAMSQSEDRNGNLIYTMDDRVGHISWLKELFTNGHKDTFGEMKKVYRGIAKCNPEDQWNEKIGMRLAANRALSNYWSDMTNRYLDLVNFLDALLYDVSSAGENSLTQWQLHKAKSKHHA